MHETEINSGSTHGSEDSPKLSPTPKSTAHHSSDEDEDDEIKQRDIVKDLPKSPNLATQENIHRDTFEVPGDSETELKNSIPSKTGDPISSLEKITEQQLCPRGPSFSLLTSTTSNRSKLHEDSEELLDIQAIEEDVHKSHNNSGSNDFRLIKGASFDREVSATKSATATNSNAAKLHDSPAAPASTKLPVRSRKQTIPVGIAVAWQRKSSSSSSNCNTSTATMSASSLLGRTTPKSKKVAKSQETTSPSEPNSTISSPVECATIPCLKEFKSTKIKNSNKLMKQKKEEKVEKVKDAKGAKIARTLNNNNNDMVVNIKDPAGSEKIEKQTDSRKVKSSQNFAGLNNNSLSTTPLTTNGGLGHHGNSNTKSTSDGRYSSSSSSEDREGFRSLNSSNINSNSYRDSWPSHQLLVPQGYAAAAAYLQHQQQLSMHQTMQLQLSHSYGYNISSCVYAGGYPADALLQYEQFLRQQQQQLVRPTQEQELLQHQQNLQSRFEMAQRQLTNGIKSSTIPSINSLSPRDSIPTPSPAHLLPAHLQQQSLYSNHSYWPSDLYQHYQQLTPPAAHQYQYQPHHQLTQQHMLTTTSSTATLSPRSLSSATPSPITINDSSFQSLLNRKCITPNPISKQFPTFSSPFSPSLVPGKDSWKDDSVDGKITPIPLVVKNRKKSSFSSLDGIDEVKTDEEILDERRRRCDSRQSMSSYKHDFRRLESLIEKREEESLPLLSSSSSISDSLEYEEETAVNLKLVKEDLDEPSRQNLVVNKSEVINCDQKKLVVPETNSAPLSLNVPTQKEKKAKNSNQIKLVGVRTQKAKKDKKPQEKRTQKSTKEKLCKAISNEVAVKKKKKKETAPVDHQSDLIKKPKTKTESKTKILKGNQKACKEDTHRNSKKNSSTTTKNAEKLSKVRKNPVKKNPKLLKNKSTNSSLNPSDIDINTNKLKQEENKFKETTSIIYSQDSQKQHGWRHFVTNDEIQDQECFTLTTVTPNDLFDKLVNPDIKEPKIYGLSKSVNSMDITNNACDSSGISSSSSMSSQYQHPLHSVFSTSDTPNDRDSSISSQISNSIDNCNTMVFNSLPTIIISPEENHLDLLATVAEEVGPLISNRNLSPTQQRRYDIIVSESNNKSEFDNFNYRRHSTESLYAAVAAAAAAEESISRKMSIETIPESNEAVSDEDQKGSSWPHKALNVTSSSQDNSKQYEYQLKIPHVVPRLQSVPKKKKFDKQQEEKKTRCKTERPNRLKTSEPKQNKKLASNLKLNNSQALKKDTKSRVIKNSHDLLKKSRVEKKNAIISKKGNLALSNASNSSENKKYSILPKLNTTSDVSQSSTGNSNLSNTCIYDFDDSESVCSKPDEGLHLNSQIKKEKEVGQDSKKNERSSVVMNKNRNNDLKSEGQPIERGNLVMKKSLLRAVKNLTNKTIGERKMRSSLRNQKDILRSKKSSIISTPNDVIKRRNTPIRNQKLPIAPAASNKTTDTALAERLSTEISPAVVNINLKPEITSPPCVIPTFPFLQDVHIPSTYNPSSIDTCSSSESSSSAWITSSNAARIVSAIKTEPFSEQERNESDDDEVSTVDTTKKKLLVKPSKLNDSQSHKRPVSITEPLKKSKFPKHSVVERSQNFERPPSPRRKLYTKPCLKVEPIIRRQDRDDDGIRASRHRERSVTRTIRSAETKYGEKIKIRKPSIDMNIFSRKVKTEAEATAECKKMDEEEVWDDNVVISGVEEMIDEMRVLTEIQGLFYTGKLNALQPPDVYGVTLDNERGAPPHIIFSAEEVLSKCIREAKPWKPSQLPHGLRICAYWSPMYTGLYSGKVSTDYDGVGDLVPVEFDDGDTGVIKICEIRLLAPNHPVAEYDPNPLLTLEKKHRKRRNSSANGSQGGCTGNHEEPDCGEPYCAKLAKSDEKDDEDNESDDDKDFNDTYRTKVKYWTWSGLGYKTPKTKKNRHKEFFHGIQRGDEIINVGDSALFISNGNDRPFIGRIERFWEKKGQKIVNVRWFYHPEEVKTKKRFVIKHPGALFESPHIDENDVQTIAKKCEVIPFKDYKQKYGARLKLNWKTGKGGHHLDNRKKAPKHSYYVAGFYDPYTFNLRMKDLK